VEAAARDGSFWIYTVIRYSVLTDVDCAIAGVPQRRVAVASAANREHDKHVIVSSLEPHLGSPVFAVISPLNAAGCGISPT